MALSPEQCASWCGGEWEPCAPSAIESVSIDTRTLLPGALYVAVRGERHDGHTYAGQAFDLGAAGVMADSDSGLAGSSERPLLRVRDTVAAMQAMAAGRRKSGAMKIIGVSGSVGKTTVKEMVASVMARKFRVAKNEGNLNNHIGLPLSVLCSPEDAEVGVFEAGINHPGEMAPLAEILSPDIGIITGIGQVHVEHFESVRQIAEEKARLLSALSSGGTGIVSTESNEFPTVAAAIQGKRIMVSLDDSDADYYSPDAAADGSFTVIEKGTGEKVRVQLPVPGRHNVSNALFAVAAGRVYGIEMSDIAGGLREFVQAGMRWTVERVGQITIINDAYNANPLSMRASLSAFEDTVSGGKWAVLGDMLELGGEAEQAHAELGTLAGGLNLAGLVVIGDFAETTARSAERAGLSAERIHICADTKAAAGILMENMREGDTVLLKGSRKLKLEDVRKEYALLLV